MSATSASLTITSGKLRSVRRLSDLPTMIRTAADRWPGLICTTRSWASLVGADGSHRAAKATSSPTRTSQARREPPGQEAVLSRSSRKVFTRSPIPQNALRLARGCRRAPVAALGRHAVILCLARSRDRDGREPLALDRPHRHLLLLLQVDHGDAPRSFDARFTGLAQRERQRADRSGERYPLRRDGVDLERDGTYHERLIAGVVRHLIDCQHAHVL